MPVIQMAFDVSGIRQGVEQANRHLARLVQTSERLEQSLRNAGSAGGSAGRGIASGMADAAGSVKRLAAEVAGLYGAFKALEKVKGFVARGIEVNEQLESAHLSLSSIISATNNIYDAQGKMLTGAEKFAAAEKISAKMMQEMQVLALQTTASFTDIASGMASVIAPATRAGIALEKLPRFVITAVQAMTTMGLQTNQMRTEIEAILSGNISKAQDMLATNLGITKEMVQQWQKSGTILEELSKRMESFNFAGQKAMNTWAGLKNNMGQALDFLARYASKDLFESLKTAYKELIDFMVEYDPSSGKIQISKNLDGLMKVLQEIEGEIGTKIVDACRELMRWISNLNKPENLANALQAWEDFKGAAHDAAVAVEGILKLIYGLGSACAWVAEKFGAMARAAYNAHNDLNERRLIYQRGLGQSGAPMAASHGKGNPNPSSVPLAPSHGKGNPNPTFTPVEPSGDTTTKPAIPPFGGSGGSKRSGGGKSDAQKLAENAERYSLSLEKMRNEVTALENAMDPALTTYDRTVAKIEAERDAAIKNAEVKARETVMRHQATQAQAEEMASLEKRKAELTAQQKLDELEVKTLRDKASFYKELGELSGDMGKSLQYQNQVIDKQAKEWAALGIPMDDVLERVRLMKLEISDNPIDGLILGLHKYASDAGSLAQTMSGAVTQAFSSMEDAFVQFTMTGKLEFKDMANSIIADLMRITVRSMILGPIANAIGGALGSLFGGGGGMASIGSSASFGASISNAGSMVASGVGLLSASGNVFAGLHGYRNSIVSSPTFFTYGSRLTRFARGGVMGEAGPEAIMPLTRTASGHLGVMANGGSSPSSMEVTLVINDQTEGGVNASAQGGKMDGRQIEVIVRQVEQSMVARAMNGKSPYTNFLDKTRGLSNAKQLY